LVVLSACQTGLGDISQGEGVFGLQRGFKKAGANSILMSLWEVDDKATQILMTQFYKNWLSGQSKHQSLLSAQKFLRETEGGKYNEPKYWAAFILLDGLN
jgi:CHAT domain-containing protein